MSKTRSPFAPCRECTCSALRRASRAVTQHYEACFRGTGLRSTQFTILATLAQTGPMPLTALAGVLGLERTTLTRNLQPLEKRQLVTTEPHADQRVRRIAITPEGEKAALKALPAWTRAQAQVRAVVQETGVEQLLRGEV